MKLSAAEITSLLLADQGSDPATPAAGFKRLYGKSAGLYLVNSSGTVVQFLPASGGTFTGDISVPDEAYDATTWNGSVEVPTKNAVRDKIEDILDGVTFTGDIIVPDEAYGVGWNGSLEVPTKNAVYDKIETVAGGGSQPTFITAIGTGSGDLTTTSSTFANIHASQLDCVVPAATGDKLLLTFETQWYQSAINNQCRIKFTVAGTVISGMPTNGLYESAHDTNSQFGVWSWPYTVQAGDISGGNVTVRPQFATNAGTLSVRNDTTNGLPFMRVINLHQ